MPQWARKEILECVWCSNCLTGRPIDLCAGRMEKRCLLLEGFCKVCGRHAVRVIEPED